MKCGLVQISLLLTYSVQLEISQSGSFLKWCGSNYDTENFELTDITQTQLYHGVTCWA